MQAILSYLVAVNLYPFRHTQDTYRIHVLQICRIKRTSFETALMWLTNCIYDYLLLVSLSPDVPSNHQAERLSSKDIR